jgi:hypothetical protein
MQEHLSDNADLLTGRNWFRGRKIMAAPGHGDTEKGEVTEGKGANSTGANIVHVHGEEKTLEVSGVGLSGKSGSKRKFAGQVPLNADYCHPRTHPPRNN